MSLRAQSGAPSSSSPFKRSYGRKLARSFPRRFSAPVSRPSDRPTVRPYLPATTSTTPATRDPIRSFCLEQSPTLSGSRILLGPHGQHAKLHEAPRRDRHMQEPSGSTSGDVSRASERLLAPSATWKDQEARRIIGKRSRDGLSPPVRRRIDVS